MTKELSLRKIQFDAIKRAINATPVNSEERIYLELAVAMVEKAIALIKFEQHLKGE